MNMKRLQFRVPLSTLGRNVSATQPALVWFPFEHNESTVNGFHEMVVVMRTNKKYSLTFGPLEYELYFACGDICVEISGNIVV